jgi:hypothetical protein
VQGGTPAEEIQRGSVKRALYMTYLRAWGPALVVPAFFLFLSLSSRVLEVRSRKEKSICCRFLKWTSLLSYGKLLLPVCLHALVASNASVSYAVNAGALGQRNTAFFIYICACYYQSLGTSFRPVFRQVNGFFKTAASKQFLQHFQHSSARACCAVRTRYLAVRVDQSGADDRGPQHAVLHVRLCCTGNGFCRCWLCSWHRARTRYSASFSGTHFPAACFAASVQHVLLLFSQCAGPERTLLLHL